METERFETVVVGGGQAGLATGYALKRAGRNDFMILDASARIGDGWRTRWDSLRLFTPARYDELPGMRFPGKRHVAPTKDEMAAYLERYADSLSLPVRLRTVVERISQNGAGFVVRAGTDEILADNVVVACGAHRDPRTPSFADRLDSTIVQMHSFAFRNRSQLRDGPVLLVGAGNSGADIAMDLVKTRSVYLSGRDVGHIPFHIESRVGRRMVRVVRNVGQHVLTWRTPVGRKVLPKLAANGSPLIRVKPKELVAAGVERVARVADVRDGKPILEDGRVLDVSNVIWCTGFNLDLSWIDLPAIGPDGAPIHKRGVVENTPGLYFVGLLFQYAATSDVLAGVSRDAAYVVDHLTRRARGRRAVPA